jgi:hypothetical protein
MLDQIYVISLINSKERQNRIKEWIPKDKTTWWLVKRKKDPKYGVFTSHRDIFIDAKSKGYKYITIFEDDATPVFDWKWAEIEIKKFLEKPPKNWKLLALGYYPVLSSKTNRNNLLSIYCSFGAHAYLANLNNISIPEWDKTQIDDLMFCDGVAEKLNFGKLKHDRGVYGIKPILFDQFSEVSTINMFHTLPQFFMEKFGNETMIAGSENVNLVILSAFIIFLVLSLTVLIPIDILYAKSMCGPKLFWITNIVFIIFFIVFSVTMIVDYVKFRNVVDVDSE